MSRSGFVEFDGDAEDWLRYGRHLGALKASIEGKRGQELLRKLLKALDTMPVKELAKDVFTTADGEFCALGALAANEHMQTDDLIDANGGVNYKLLSERFNASETLLRTIMFCNDEDDEPDATTPHLWAGMRWVRMRTWVVSNLKPQGAEA